MRETLRELAGEVTILSISHQPALRRAADIAYLMREGRLIRLTEQAGRAERLDTPARSGAPT